MGQPLGQPLGQSLGQPLGQPKICPSDKRDKVSANRYGESTLRSLPRIKGSNCYPTKIIIRHLTPAKTSRKSKQSTAII